MLVLDNLLYTRDHEWVKVEGNNAYIGITDYAQKLLGDIVYVDLPDVDSEFTIGDSFGVIESVKAAEDNYMPLSGKVIDINEDLSDRPELLNEKPFENWIIEIEIGDEDELKELLSAEDYKKMCDEEE